MGNMLTDNEAFKLVNQRFPHIGQRLMASWGRQELVAYIDGLVNVARDEVRQGFPGEIVRALMTLKCEHDLEFPLKVAESPKEGDPNRLVENEELKKVNQRFPHIGRQLQSLWGCPDFSVYINQLLSDTRGGSRQGFPVEVARALFKLLQVHDREFPQHASDIPDIWNLNRGE